MASAVFCGDFRLDDLTLMVATAVSQGFSVVELRP